MQYALGKSATQPRDSTMSSKRCSSQGWTCIYLTKKVRVLKEIYLLTPTKAFELVSPNLSLQIWSEVLSRPNVCRAATNALRSLNRRDRFFTVKVLSGWVVVSFPGIGGVVAASGARGSRNECAGGIGLIMVLRAPTSRSIVDAIEFPVNLSCPKK